MWNKLKTGFPWAGVPEEEMEEADGEKTQKELDEEIKRKKERQVHTVNCKKQEEWQVHCKNQEDEGTTGTLYKSCRGVVV